MKKETVNFGIQDVWPIALVLIVTGIGVAFGLDIIDDVDDGFVAGSAAANASSSATDAIANLADKLPTIALVIVAAILIGILVRNLGGSTQ